VDRLATESVPLTVCPLSNAKLHVFPSLAASNLPTLLERGLRVTINSDDPAYFGGYLADNLLAVAQTFSLSCDQIVGLVRNSFLSSFLSDSEKEKHLADIERIAQYAPECS
jgi:adenosine deaminase